MMIAPKVMITRTRRATGPRWPRPSAGVRSRVPAWSAAPATRHNPVAMRPLAPSVRGAAGVGTSGSAVPVGRQPRALDARWRVSGVPSDPNPGLFRAGWHVVLLVLCAALMRPFSLGVFPVLSCLLLCHVRSDCLAAAHCCGPSSVLFCCDLEGPLARPGTPGKVSTVTGNHWT